VARDQVAAKKAYSVPSFQILDAGSAKAELQATGASDDDANVQKMLSVLNQPRDGKPVTVPSALRKSLP
jgi:hypothetical protein